MRNYYHCNSNFSCSKIQFMPRKKLYHFFTFNIWLLCLLFITQKVCAQTCTEVIGYYPNWQWYDRGQLVKPTTIQYSKYSIINYAFFKPEGIEITSGRHVRRS